LADRESGDKIDCAKNRISGTFARFPWSLVQRMNGWLGREGIEPPNGGIKIRSTIQRLQGAFGKDGQNTL
jgi:hypothetical protein